MGLTEKIVGELELLEKQSNGQANAEIKGIKHAAISAFQKLGIPSNRHEEWRYTHIKPNLPETLSVLSNTTGAVVKGKINFFENIEATKLVFVDGRFEESLSSVIAHNGVTVGSLKQHVFNGSANIENYNTLVKKYEEHFSVLNTALVNDGAFVKIAKNTIVEHPIFILQVYTTPEYFAQGRNLIIAEEGADVKLMVDFQCTANALFYNYVSEVFIGSNAHVDITQLQTATTGATAVHTLEADVAQDGKFTCNTITLEGKLIRNSTNVRLSGSNSETHMNGLYYGKGNSLIDNHILVDHLVPNCQSNQLYKGILDDESTGVFNGKILVKPDAQKTNAFQSSKAVLLSKEAGINSKPQLEIFADDVKCSHGAAIGQLSDNEVFYLKARGIPEKQARAILTYAFAKQIVDGIAIPGLKTYLDEELKNRLGIDF